GYNANYGGLLIGADKAINDNWRAGGAFTYSNTAVNSTGDTTGDTARINSYGLIGYASYTGNPWYVNLSGAVMAQQYDTSRQVNFQGFSGTANGQFNGQQYVARAEAGYPLALNGVTLTPLASLTYSYQNQGSYTESGGNGAALAVNAAHADSVKSGLGAKLEKSFSTHYGEIVPELQLQWIHEYDHTAQVTGASFAADPTGQTAFTTVGATPVSNLADLSLGVTLLKANNLSLSARYELQAARGFVSQTGSLRLRQLF
ncbi:MAG TPA: autotransporter domain-containing protein, partial [Herbaspirillum sp.]|nr:autotransporter domain-containing protein [Herbaspirillum sp.]